MTPSFELKTNHYLILRVLEQVPKDAWGVKASEIAEAITELNKVWVISVQSISSHLATLRALEMVEDSRVYHEDARPFYWRGRSYQPYHTEWRITKKGQDVLV